MRLRPLERVLVGMLLGVSLLGLWRIVGTDDSHDLSAPPRWPAAGEWPQVAAVVRSWAPTTGAYDAYLCTSSFVAADTLVTAAHCVDGYDADDLLVVVGERNLCTAPVASFVAVAAIDRAASTRERDDGPVLLRLAAAPADTEWFPIGDPTVHARRGARATVLGWGAVHSGGRRPCELVASRPLLRAADECRSSMAANGIALAAHEFCAGDPTGDACHGDSGGPLLVDSVTGAQIIGIVLRGPGCLTTPWGGVYGTVTGIEAHLRAR